VKRVAVRLAVDIGNSNATVGVYDAARAAKKALAVLRLPSDARSTADSLYGLLQPHLGCRFTVKQVAIASVVPRAVRAWEQLADRLAASRVTLDPLAIPDIALKLRRPEEAGIDRVVNAWMGRRRYGAPLVIVDMGTATTFDVVDGDGAYAGGIIAPGVRLFADALAEHTAKLPYIELSRPDRAVGRDTVEAMRSGAVLGQAAMIDGLIDRVMAETGRCPVVATGGNLPTLRPFLGTRFRACDSTLLLDGIDAVARLMEKPARARLRRG